MWLHLLLYLAFTQRKFTQRVFRNLQCGASSNQLGIYCIRKAISDESDAEQYVNKMERITAKRRYGARMGTEGFVPPNDVALYLAAWYHKVGRDEEAHEAVKAHIQDALVILSDDDPSNDMEGYFNLSRALLAIGDERNAVAIFNAIRPYKNGLAVIEKPEGEDEEVHTLVIFYHWNLY